MTKRKALPNLQMCHIRQKFLVDPKTKFS